MSTYQRSLEGISHENHDFTSLIVDKGLVETDENLWIQLMPSNEGKGTPIKHGRSIEPDSTLRPLWEVGTIDLIDRSRQNSVGWIVAASSSEYVIFF